MLHVGHRFLHVCMVFLMSEDCLHWAECNPIGARDFYAGRMPGRCFQGREGREGERLACSQTARYASCLVYFAHDTTDNVLCDSPVMCVERNVCML
jgi:hypothetical protein